MSNPNKPQHFGGYKIVISKPYKNWMNKWGWYRNKGKRRTQRYWVHVGWTEVLSDGKIVKNEEQRIMYMNATTYQSLCNAIELERRQVRIYEYDLFGVPKHVI